MKYCLILMGNNTHTCSAFVDTQHSLSAPSSTAPNCTVYYLSPYNWERFWRADFPHYIQPVEDSMTYLVYLNNWDVDINATLRNKIKTLLHSEMTKRNMKSRYSDAF